MMTLMWITGSAVAGYAAIVVLMAIMQRSFIYFPSNEKPNPTKSSVPEMTEVSLRTADGLTVYAWFAPAPAGRPTVLYFHGNAHHIGARDHRARAFLDAGFGVLLLEYRGYGGNPGHPTEEGLFADARAALQFLLDRDVAAKDIVVNGESLGTGVAVRMAAEQAISGTPLGAVILEAPYTSVTDVAQARFPWLPVRQLLKDRFDSLAVIHEINAPLLIVHGADDEVIAVKYGKRLYEAAKQPKQAVWVDGARHNDLTSFGLDQIAIQFMETTYGLKTNADID
jgi:fermentation-respiration switch protein FrsA (DUF1100 family)